MADISTRTLTVVTYGVLAGWIANLIAPLFAPNYPTSAGVNGVMGAMIGLLTATIRVRKQAGKKKRPGDDDD